jgi:nucleoside-diphosphate-sugar epimerase
MTFKKYAIMKPILITGANGFLGSHLADFYLKQDTEIYGISHGLSKFSKVNQIHDDILTAKILPNDVSTILHFAALTDIQYCENNPSECYKINVEGTKNILELARKNDSNLIFASSSHVYGKPNSLPILETDPLNPISIHAKSKVKAESLCEEYAVLYGINISIIRTFSIFGSGSPSYALISRIINQILNNKKIILGNLDSKRDFLHISDFLDAIDVLIKSKIKGCSKFNIGSGESFSVNDVCHNLLRISGSSNSIEFDSNLIRNNDVHELVCDNYKLKKLGWSPKLSFNAGLEQVFNYFKTNSNYSQ